MKHQLKEDIRDQYIYGILEDSGERIMPTLDELIKKHDVPSSTLYRISSKVMVDSGCIALIFRNINKSLTIP